jgi:hypothetical protein
MADHLPENAEQDTPEAHRLRFEAATRQLLNTPKKPKTDKPKTEQTSEKKHTN